MKINKFTATLIVLLMATAAVGASRSYMRHEGIMSVVPMKGLHARSKGNPSAPLKIVEHLDYQCGSCRYAAGLLHEYLKKYPDRMFLEVRFHPLTGHPHGELAATYAQCAADQGNFWPFHELLFERQQGWAPLPDAHAAFRQVAIDSGMDIARMEVCVASPATLEKVRAEKKDSASRGVASTPSFFINGTMVVGPKMLLNELDKYFPNEKPAEAAN